MTSSLSIPILTPWIDTLFLSNSIIYSSILFYIQNNYMQNIAIINCTLKKTNIMFKIE